MDSTHSIADYYNKHFIDEEFRLSTNSSEYLITYQLIKNYLKSGDNILDLGGGTGVYSIPIRLEGYDVTIVDLSIEELSMVQRKAKQLGLDLTITQGDACKYLNPQQYDIILCLGPLYHCCSEDNISNIITNVLKNLRRGGYAFFAFISMYSKFNNFIDNVNEYTIEDLQSLKSTWKNRIQLNKTFIYEKRNELPIVFANPLLVNQYLNKFDVEVIDTLAVDVCKQIKNYNEDIFDMLYTIGKGYMMSRGEHLLSIVKKI